jgi:hypothetical protein
MGHWLSVDAEKRFPWEDSPREQGIVDTGNADNVALVLPSDREARFAGDSDNTCGADEESDGVQCKEVRMQAVRLLWGGGSGHTFGSCGVYSRWSIL